MIRALVVTHGGLGAELCKIVERLVGPVEGLASLSNAGRSAEQLVTDVRDGLVTVAGDAPPAPTVILVDHYGGSCTNAARLAAVDRPETRIVCGVNLAMLLGFVSWRESLDLPDLVGRLIRVGREAIVEAGTDH